MKDYVLRVKPTKELLSTLEEISLSKEQLSKIEDHFFKPNAVSLEKFNPAEIIVRKRIYPDRIELCQLEVRKDISGYETKKTIMDNFEGYEEWGKFNCQSVLHIVRINEEKVRILHEFFSFGEYIKIEAQSVNILNETLDFFGVDNEKRIEKNSSLLLAESMKLI